MKKSTFQNIIKEELVKVLKNKSYLAEFKKLVIKEAGDYKDVSNRFKDALDDLPDSKFSKKNIHATEIENEHDEYSMWNVSISYVKNGKNIILGKGKHSKKKEAEQLASRDSIKKLNKLGYSKDVDSIYKEINK